MDYSIKKRYSLSSSLIIALIVHILMVMFVVYQFYQTDAQEFFKTFYGAWSHNNMPEKQPVHQRLATWVFSQNQKDEDHIAAQENSASSTATVADDSTALRQSAAKTGVYALMQKRTSNTDAAPSIEPTHISEVQKKENQDVTVASCGYGMHAIDQYRRGTVHTVSKAKRTKNMVYRQHATAQKRRITLADLTDSFLKTIRVQQTHQAPGIIKGKNRAEESFYQYTMMQYIKEVVRSIENEIYLHPYPSKNIYKLLYVVLSLEIDKNGILKHTIVEHQSGDASYDDFIKSITYKVSPFAPIPSSLKTDTLKISLVIPLLLESQLRVRRPFIQLAALKT